MLYSHYSVEKAVRVLRVVRVFGSRRRGAAILHYIIQLQTWTAVTQPGTQLARGSPYSWPCRECTKQAPRGLSSEVPCQNHLCVWPQLGSNASNPYEHLLSILQSLLVTSFHKGKKLLDGNHLEPPN